MKKIKLITIVIAVVIAVLFLIGCVFTPRLITVYDEKCKIEVKHMVLEASEIQILSGCTNEHCIHTILAAGVISAGSAIISGSIVITSNIVYWLEKPKQCK